ncbi:hypothetical protein [Streptomyces europaeiscabiei]|uniref:hypothetical protein n=1 Tax=Streptomyces europaeiscabiei TaxID=146819 RepID=UPI00131ADB8D|nr:hypothetical protein [Streptomyces europaeiscabiei]MDX3840067.1 hypothetical protein [Streptomyces europaeiscabiei]
MTERKTAAPRVAIPQVDPEAPKPAPATTVSPAEPPVAPQLVEAAEPTRPAVSDQEPASERPIYLTPVDTDEQPISRGLAMYPSRHTQIVRDIAYIEGRRPWKIIEDALEEYVVKHYGKQYKRK